MSELKYYTFTDQQGDVLRTPVDSFHLHQETEMGTAIKEWVRVTITTPTSRNHVLWNSIVEVRKVELDSNFNLSDEAKKEVRAIESAAHLMYKHVISSVNKNNPNIDINEIWNQTLAAWKLDKENEDNNSR